MLKQLDATPTASNSLLINFVTRFAKSILILFFCHRDITFRKFSNCRIGIFEAVGYNNENITYDK